MTILGITITHDGTICVLKDGKNTYSIGEERLNRIKCYIGFPFRALEQIIQNKIIDPKEISLVAVSSGTFKKEWARSYAFELVEDKKYYDLVNFKQPKDFYIADEEWKKVSSDEECEAYVEKKIKALLAKSGIEAPIVFVDHHLSHAASAYYSSGKNEALAITLDGEGDGLSATVSVCKNGKIERIHSEPVKHSIGYLYSEVTKFCGFRATRHEGKITGLAAHGDINRSKAHF
jgi:carbamoyltransferase